jgi:hypothetical protein
MSEAHDTGEEPVLTGIRFIRPREVLHLPSHGWNSDPKSILFSYSAPGGGALTVCLLVSSLGDSF